MKRDKNAIYLTVLKGALAPVDAYASKQLRERGYRIGDTVKATLAKINNPKFHRLVHRIGQLCVANIEAFSGMDAHSALKRIQLEANIQCDEIAGKGMVWRIPRSMSFDHMDDGERHELALAICRHVSLAYWPDLQPEQIAEMADSWVDE